MRVVGVIPAVAAAVLFDRIVHRHFGERARWGSLCFAAGTAADLLIGRVTFALGAAFALGAILALQRGHRRSGVALALGCTLASPVAGLFLALGGIAHWLATRTPIGLCVAAAAFIPAAGLSLLFPEGGSQPYAANTLASIVLCCGLLLWLLPRRERVLRSGMLLYLAASALAFAVATPMGGNASRLGVAFAGPLLLCAVLAGDNVLRRRGVIATTVLLLGWQWWAPVRETIKGAIDPSGQAAYFAPLLRFIDAQADAAVRCSASGRARR